MSTHEDIIGIILFAIGGGTLLAVLQLVLPYSGYPDEFAGTRLFIVGSIAFFSIGAGLLFIIRSAVSSSRRESSLR